MVQWHGRSRRKTTGGRIRFARKKRKYELGRPFGETKTGSIKKKTIRTRGGNKKIRLLQVEYANIVDPKTNTSTRVSIDDITGNPANRNYARRKMITKGAIIKTPKGSARVTSRPGQEGIVNAILVE